MHSQFTIFSDQPQLSAVEVSATECSTALTDREEMELHPAVTSAFVPETFAVRSEIFDDMNNTG